MVRWVSLPQQYKNSCIFLAVRMRLCIIYQYHRYVYYVYKKSNLVCANAFVLSFLPSCSVLAYHGYQPRHQGMLITQISLTLFHPPVLSSIALGKSSWQHPVSVQSWWMQAFVGRPTLVCVGVHRRMSLMSSTLLYQPFSAYLDRFTWMVCEIGYKWSYSIVFQDLFKTACSI